MDDYDSFRLHRSDSFIRRIFSRSQSSRTPLDSSVSVECVQLLKYEKLSLSVRSPKEPPRWKAKFRVWKLLTDIVVKKPIDPEANSSDAEDGDMKKDDVKKMKKKASWLPNARWPVQGW